MDFADMAPLVQQIDRESGVFRFKIFGRLLAPLTTSDNGHGAFALSFGDYQIQVWRSVDAIPFHGNADYASVINDDAWVAFRGESAKSSLSYLGAEFCLPRENTEKHISAMFTSLQDTLDKLKTRYGGNEHRIREFLATQATPLNIEQKKALSAVFIRPV